MKESDVVAAAQAIADSVLTKDDRLQVIEGLIKFLDLTVEEQIDWIERYKELQHAAAMIIQNCVNEKLRLIREKEELEKQK